MISRCPVEFDVTEAAGLGSAAVISGTLYLADHHCDARRIVLLVPGGGFTRRYYDLEVDGHRDYSAAQMLASEGIVVVAIDNLGTGTSTIPPDGGEVTLDRSASALAEVVRQIRQMAQNGTMASGLPPVEPVVIGIGHSLGGCIMTIVQGHHSACDAVGILGFSCRYIVGAVDPKTGQRLREREYTGNGYNRTTPSAQRERFYMENVPMAVIEAEEGARIPMPNGVAEALVPGRTALAAAAIDVPVLLAFGERDVSPDPYTEPSFYHRSPDVTLLMLRGAGHAHNSAPDRVAFWNRIGAWAKHVVPTGDGGLRPIVS